MTVSSLLFGFFSVNVKSSRDRCFGACVALLLRHRLRNSTPEVWGPTYAAVATRLMNTSATEGGCHIYRSRVNPGQVRSELDFSLCCLVTGTWIRVPCSNASDQRTRKRTNASSHGSASTTQIEKQLRLMGSAGDSTAPRRHAACRARRSHRCAHGIT
jgi:hypothetical protein